jgi:hypothetical protein
MKTPAPKHRAIIHLAADMRKGAGAHGVARKPGPSVEEWDDARDLEWEEERGRILVNTFTEAQ